MPLIVQSTKQHTTSFNLSIINTHMQIATNNKATLVETKVAIVSMYQNGTTAKLSPQAQKAAHALANYIYANKTRQKFAFVLGKDHQDQQLLLLTIANHPAPSQVDAFLQRRTINQDPSSPQKRDVLSLVKQLQWVSNALQQVEFGILFWIYHHRLSGQEAIEGTKQVPPAITAVNFPRVKTPHEQLQTQAWAKMMRVVHHLTSRQLKIHADAQQSPSQTKITTRDIVLAIRKFISSDDEISKVAKKLIREDNIEVQPDDKMGAMMITIKNYGPAKIITIFGFKATATPLEVSQAKIKAAKNGASLPTRLSQVFHGQMPIVSNVNEPIKDGVTFKFQLATIVNNKGASTLTYEVDANPQVKGATPQKVTFIVSGFETKDQKDAREVIKKRLDRIIQNIHDGALEIPEGITSRQFNAYVQAMGDVLNEKGEFIRSKFAEQYKTHITSLTIPHSFTSIGPWFQHFDKIILLHIPNSVTTIVKYAFERALLTSLRIPDLVTTIGANAFAYSPLTTLTLGEAFQTIGDRAFQSARLRLLHIPNSVTTIGNYAFQFSPLTSLSLGDHLQTIGAYAFQHAQLRSLHIPNLVTTIEHGAFHKSPLTSLSLGNQLQTIGVEAFNSAQLRSLHIPNSVTAIGKWAFISSPLTIVNIFEGVKLHEHAFKDGVIIKRILRPSS